MSNVAKNVIKVIVACLTSVVLMASCGQRESDAPIEECRVEEQEENIESQDIFLEREESTETQDVIVESRESTDLQDVLGKKEEEKSDSARELAYPYNTWGMSYPYDCLEASDSRVLELMEKGGGNSFSCQLFIKGLVGYTPVSSPSGGIQSYKKDKEIVISNNVGMGLLKSERLAVVQDGIREMFMDILGVKGENAIEYQNYFSDTILIEKLKAFMEDEIEADWVLLDGEFLCDYAGNSDEISWIGAENNEKRLAETASHYNFYFIFYADYRTMGYGENDKAAVVEISCSVSKETGQIDELAIDKWYIGRSNFETSRF